MTSLGAVIRVLMDLQIGHPCQLLLLLLLDMYKTDARCPPDFILVSGILYAVGGIKDDILVVLARERKIYHQGVL